MFSNVSNASSALPAQAWLLSGPASCFLFSFSFTIFTSFSITNIAVVLPFSLCVWFLGLRRRRLQKSTTHLDMFTYHMTAVEMVAVAACAAYLYSFYANAGQMMFTAMQVYSNTSKGQTVFHIFTCLDRYVAVVHPITYIRLKEKGGVRLRNFLIACVWVAFISEFFFESDANQPIQLAHLVFSVAVILFCNFAVLYVLIRPPPGERVHVSQSKRKAFNTIVLILSALLFRMVLHLAVVGLFSTNLLSKKKRCAALVSGVFFILPSSVVLPLLFLKSKATCCKGRSESPVTATTS